MFTIKQQKPEELPGLDDAITSAIESLKDHDPYSPEYVKAVEQIEKLYKLKAPQPELRKPVSYDALIAAGANLAGIIAVLGYERAHVITSKALGFIVKTRL